MSLLAPTAPDDFTATPRRSSILIVDDVPANLGVLFTFLEEAGYEVFVAESGEGALSQLEYAVPDIILLDVMMPGLDGYETCRRLKADARWCETPVLFLTALNEPTDKVRGFAVGAVDFITKPLHPEEVLARVGAHLQIRALQRRLEANNLQLQHAVARRLEAEEQLAQSLDRAVLVVRDGGGIEFCTALARRLLERYFPEARSPDRLPAPLAGWVADAGGEPWSAVCNGARLRARRFAEAGAAGDQNFMLLLEETLPPSTDADGPARLLPLGLTVREAEVLYWTAHGKTGPEIAIILAAAPNTIKKHVQNILVKLGVETRFAAALQAAELLGLQSVEPSKLRD